MKHTVYLVGNPNCGKTTLFNQLTGLRQKTGNFSGVTVEQKSGIIYSGDNVMNLVDLPGTYGMGGKTEDKRITYEILLKRNPNDKIIYVIDALNLERGLQFLLQVLDMGASVFVVMTMKDVLEKKNVKLDIDLLEKILGLNIHLINAKSDDGITDLKQYLFHEDKFQSPGRKWEWENKEESLLISYKKSLGINNTLGEFFLCQSLKFLSNDPSQTEIRYLDTFPQESVTWLKTNFISKDFNFSYQEEIIRKSFYIKQILAKVIMTGGNINRKFDTKLDSVLLHPFFGFVFFFTIMGLLFQTLFTFAEYPMDMIENGISALQNFASVHLTDGLFKALLVEGILGGVGSVIVFVPQIALLFTFLGILEESGYLARASFLMDKTMGKFGLSGKSFIPLLSSAACAVPAIMGTRTIENKSDRLTTIMISPLIMCSARYPVYILIVGTIFQSPPLFDFINVQGLVLFGMFLLGMTVSLVIGLIFRKSVFKEDSSYFIMELPRYLMPSLRSLGYSVYQKVKAFLQSAGQIILYISILLWFLSSFPVTKTGDEWKTSLIENSYIGYTGKFIEPVLTPLGFDWKIGISIITSFAAREVMVSTLAVLYGTEDDAESSSLREKLREEKKSDGTKLWSPLTGISLLLFFAFASQCMSTLAIVRKETQSIFWPTIQFFYMTGLAVISSLLVFQIGKFLGFS
ncbi:MAG: ferrous iron transport protein B [Leptospira sp.]|nr:ferrous iron transport protein B [Leptospira sp.]